jgi:3-hydroxyisobutyrate dehydrogenase-like beta-hydroxyacid dehydrogenase
MSGGTVGAEAGTLTFMLGAPSALVPRVNSILKHMGKRVVYLGDQGSGLCGKLANNYLLALNNIATAEAMNLGMQLGLNPKTLAGMINSSTGKCWPSEVNNPVPGVVETAPASRDYSGGFGVSLMKKDLGLAIDAADAIGIDMSKGLGQKCKEIYDDCEKDEKCKGKDFSVVYRWLGGKE